MSRPGATRVVLRRLDEAAKVPGRQTPPFAAFRPLLRSCARATGKGGR